MRRAFLIFSSFVAAVACVHTPPPHPRALENNEMCVVKLNQNDLQGAEVYCDLGLQFAPNYADLWVNKGLIYLRRGQRDKAKDAFIKALRYNQEQQQAYNNLGTMYLEDEQYGKAHDNFRRALKTNPDFVEARYNLAVTLRKMGDFEKSRHELRTILAINPNIAEPYVDLGSMALEDNLTDEAIEMLVKSTRLDPGFSKAWFYLGNAYMEAGRFAEAVESYTSCIEADPKHAECRNALPIAVRRRELLDPALKELKEERTSPQSAPSLLQLAKTYRSKGLRREEELTYRKCVKVDPRYPLCHYGLFLIYSEDRRDRDAGIGCENFLKFALASDFPRETETCEKFLKANAP